MMYVRRDDWTGVDKWTEQRQLDLEAPFFYIYACRQKKLGFRFSAKSSVGVQEGTMRGYKMYRNVQDEIPVFVNAEVQY